MEGKGIRKKVGPNTRGEDGGHGGVYVWESVCAQQAKGATAEEEEEGAAVKLFI